MRESLKGDTSSSSAYKAKLPFRSDKMTTSRKIVKTDGEVKPIQEFADTFLSREFGEQFGGRPDWMHAKVWLHVLAETIISFGDFGDKTLSKAFQETLNRLEKTGDLTPQSPRLINWNDFWYETQFIHSRPKPKPSKPPSKPKQKPRVMYVNLESEAETDDDTNLLGTDNFVERDSKLSASTVAEVLVKQENSKDDDYKVDAKDDSKKRKAMEEVKVKMKVKEIAAEDDHQHDIFKGDEQQQQQIRPNKRKLYQPKRVK